MFNQMFCAIRLQCVSLFLVCGFLNGFADSPQLKFEHYTSERGLPQNTIHGIVKDKYGFMWFGTWSGLCKFDGYKFKIYRHDPSNAKSISNDRIHNIIKDSEQNIWVQTFDESILCKYNYQTDDFERIPQSQVSPAFRKLVNRPDHYIDISFVHKSYQWSIAPGTHSLVQKSLKHGTLNVYSPNPASRWSLNDPYVTDIYLDNHNIFWVGTYSNGINKANILAKPFRYFYHDPANKNSIIDNNIRAICEDKVGNLWLGTRDQGITVVGRDKRYRHLQHNPVDKKTIRSNQIKNIFCDSRGFLWIGTKKGLDRYDPSTDRIRHFELLGLDKVTVYDAIEDHEKNIWFASWRGIYKYLPQSDSILHFKPSETLPNMHARIIMQDKERQIWVGTEGGGVSVLRESSPGKLTVLQHFGYSKYSSNTLSDNRVYSMIEDSEGFIWIGTGNGLNRFNPVKRTFKRFSVSVNTLPSAMISAIVEDDNGSIWVSHKRGISRINKKTLAVRNYSLQDGLQSNEFSEHGAYKSPSTKMLFFGGNNGYNSFYPDSIKPDYTIPDVVLTDLQILNKTVEVGSRINGRILLKKPLYLCSEIDLSHLDRSIAIEFAGLHYSNPEGNKYAYMLKGFDKDWVYTDASRRLATYSNLEPGEYTFMVRASNSDGIWNPVPKTLKITIAPALWASNFAYVMYTLIVFALLYAFYYYSVRYTRLKSKLAYESIIHEKEFELHENKIQFFTNISHEIKTPLSLILAPIERLMIDSKENKHFQNQLRTMRENGDRLLKLINQLLDIRRFETGNDKLLPGRHNAVAFTRDIVESFRQMAVQRSISLELISQNGPLFFHFDSDKIEKVLYNLLSNAFKFTGDGGEIKMYLRQTSEFLIIEVVDNGIGIPEEDIMRIFKPFQQGTLNKAGGTGLGLAYSKALVELHGGTIGVRSTAGIVGSKLTTFTIKLPGCADDKSPDTSILSDRRVSHPVGRIASSVEPAPDVSFKELGKTPTLLLVEDSFDLRNYLRECFVGEYTVLEASNGVEGFELALKHSPDIIISDVMMPQMDGIELSRKLKEDILTSHIPVILLTARTPIEYQIEGISTGADDYLVKPFNFTLLSLKIRNMLLSRIRLREKFKSKLTIQASSINPVSPDEKLLKRLLDYIEDKIAAPDLNIDHICGDLGFSRTNLYRKIKALTGMGIAEVIKEIRLNRAQQLLSDRKFNVNEVSYMVGFTEADYFRKCFKAHFGVSPSEYAKSSLKEKT